MAKLKLALYWASSCGGCEVTVLDLHEKILNVTEVADIVFWPIALDFKYKDVEAMPDKEIDVCLFNGAIRNTENQEIAELLRQKSKALVAFGSCSHLGGIPGLGNVANREEIFKTAYQGTISTVNENFTTPKPKVTINNKELHIPEFYDTVKALNQVVDVDYFMPGCPPATKQVEAVVGAIASGQLPPKGSVIGASTKSLCDECERKKEEKKIKQIKRTSHYNPEPETCMLEQGFVCMGPATRGGCGAQCINSNMPCRGCYGPLDDIEDQGAKVLSAITSVIDSDDPDEIKEIIDQIEDPLGTFYRFSLPVGYLKRVIVEK